MPARGGAEVALGLYYKIILMYRLHAPCASQARACLVFFETVALLSKNMTCARPRRNATPSEHFLHTSHCALHAPHSTLHTCTSHSTLHLISSHLISSELFSSHFISSRMSANFFLTTFISSEHSSTFLILPKLVSTHLGSSARQKA